MGSRGELESTSGSGLVSSDVFAGDGPQFRLRHTQVAFHTSVHVASAGDDLCAVFVQGRQRRQGESCRGWTPVIAT